MDKEYRHALVSCIVDAGLDKDASKARYAMFRGDFEPIQELIEQHGSKAVTVALQVGKSSREKAKRVRDKISTLVLSGHCIFLTLTFRDDVLDSTSMQTRRRYVARFLKAQCKGYAANIDFGDDGRKRLYVDRNGKERMSTGREHYHALVYAPVDVNLKAWSYGRIDAERVHDSSKDLEKCSKYVAKLSNHALKVNKGIAPRLIYSRGDCFFSEIMDF